MNLCVQILITLPFCKYWFFGFIFRDDEGTELRASETPTNGAKFENIKKIYNNFLQDEVQKPIKEEENEDVDKKCEDEDNTDL